MLKIVETFSEQELLEGDRASLVRSSGMATYADIQRWGKSDLGSPRKPAGLRTARISMNFPVGMAANRQGHERMCPCPLERRPAIRHAFEHFGMLAVRGDPFTASRGS